MLYEKHKIYILTFTVMLHIIKQIKGGFIGFIESNFLDKQVATDLADSFDTDKNNKISWKEMKAKFNKLVLENSKLDSAKKNLIIKIYNDKVNNKDYTKEMYRINKQEFIKLLTNQEAEHTNVLTKHESAKRKVRKESSEKLENSESIVINFAKNYKELKNNKDEVFKLQNALLSLDKNSLPKYWADKDFWNETVKAMNKVVRNFNNEVKNKKLSTSNSIWDFFNDIGNNISNAFDWENNKEKLSEKDKAIKTILEFDKKHHTPKEVKELQKALKIMWHKLKGINWGIDGKFGWSTKKAYKSELATSKHVENLTMISDYTEAYSNVYGDMDKVINRHHGLLWQILKYTSDSDLSKMHNKLGVKYPNVATEKKLVEEFNLDKNSPEYKKGLMRIVTALAVSAVVSAISSGWNTIDLCVELFWINKHQIWKLFGIDDWGVSYAKSLSPEDIIKILTGKKIDFKKDNQDAYLEWMETNTQIKRILKASLKNDIPTLKRVTETIKDNNFIENFVELFDNKVGDLIKKLDGETDVKKVDDIMWKIWYLILPELYEAQKSWNQEAQAAYVELASIIWRYNNIEKKYDKINGIWLDIPRIKELATKADNWIQQTYKKRGEKIKITTNTKNLHSKWSFWYDLWKVNNFKDYTKELASHSYKKWGESMLASIMATVAEQISWISFRPDHFIEWMEKMKKVTNSEKVKILSNLWRGNSQKFQGTLWNWELYQMDVDWMTIYFKDKCTNPIAVVNNQTTTVQFAWSIPIYAKLNIRDKKEPVNWGWDNPENPNPENPNPENPNPENPVEEATTQTWVDHWNLANSGSGSPTSNTPVVDNTWIENSTPVPVENWPTWEPLR